MVFTGTIPVSDVGQIIKQKIAKMSIPKKMAKAIMARNAMNIRRLYIKKPLKMGW